MQQKTEEIALEALRRVFYPENRNTYPSKDDINLGLNLFYNNRELVKDSTAWVNSFKMSIKTNEGPIGKKKEISKKQLDILNPYEIINHAFHKRKKNDILLESLFSKLICVNQTIIYEAPPYRLLLDIDGQQKFDGDYILDEKCDSAYAKAINKCFGGQSSVSEVLTQNNCGFFDVIPIPLPINSDLRKSWATDRKFVINGKRIFVHFFEWARDSYLKMIPRSPAKGHKLAIGIPLNNSITLYEYYSSNELMFGKTKIEFNAPHTFNMENKKPGLWFHPYKNCVIDTSNNPNGELMKLAFDIAGNQ